MELFELFPHLSKGDLQQLRANSIATSQKIKRFKGKEKEAGLYIDKALADFSNDRYREKFYRVFSRIDPQGIALKNSVIRTAYYNMIGKKSYFEYFAFENNKANPNGPSRALKNAFSLFYSSKYNAKTTFSDAKN